MILTIGGYETIQYSLTTLCYPFCRDVMELEEAMKSKDREAEAYIGEMEVISFP